MSKEKQSKLDAHAERLDEWFGVQKKTLDEVRQQLALDGVSVSCSRLSDWWSRRQGEKQQAMLLANIASGARQVKEVEEAFKRNPAPALETINKLHRVLTMQMATGSVTDPSLIELAERCTKMVLEFAKLEEAKASREFGERKYRDEVAERKRAMERELNAAKSSGGILPETFERIERELKLL